MITLKKTNSSQQDFMQLVQLLDADLKIRDGDDHDFYHQFNGITDIQHCLVAYIEDIPVGCGAIKPFNTKAMEVKRMYVLPEYRGRGVALIMLSHLEQWSKNLGYKTCILETGKQQPEAIALYKKAKYDIIPNYGQYSGIINSVCFEKQLL